MYLTPAQQTLLRNQPHKTELWLSIYRPRTVASAIVTGTYSIGDTTIDFISYSGTSIPAYQDMTTLVGSQPGLDDYGRIRARGVSGTYAIFAENAISWETGQYLTFIDYITPEAVYPKIIQDPSQQTNVIFYKDDNIPYTNQNTIYGTFACAGPHRAGFLSSGTATVFYTATGTYNVKGDSLTYSWNFDGGTPTGSSAFTPGNVTYSTPGHYKTRLRVTSSSGAIDDTYRYVSIYNRPNEGTNVPILRWELQELSGSRSEGGHTASFKVFDNIGEVEPNALVVIFADSWYGGTNVNLGGNALGNSSIIFVGYILGDTIRFNYQESSVEFSVGNISEIMKNTEGFSVSCESVASPSTWFQLHEMTVPKAIYHYLRWHSTILKTTDFQYLNDDRLVQYFDADRGSLFDAVDNFMREGMLGSVISDRQGKLWAEVSPFGLENPITTIPTNFTLHKQDWINSPSIQERRNTELSFIELGGIAFYGVSSNAFSALLTNAPSTAPLYYGKSDRKDGLILVDQTSLNKISGNYLAYYNSDFPNVSMSLAGFYNNIDIAPQERLYLVIDQNDSVRGKSIQGIPYTVESMEWNYNSRQERFAPEITLAQLATGTAGITVNIPAIPPDNGYTSPDLSLPPIPIFGTSTSVGSTIPLFVLFHDQSAGFIYTNNFDAASPNYLQMNGGLTQAQYQQANFMFVTPGGAVYVGKAIADTTYPSTRNMFLARAPALGQPFTIIYDHNNLNGGGGRYGVFAASFDPTQSERVAVVIEIGGATQKIYIGSGGSFSEGASVANTNFLGSLSYGKSFWLYTTYNTFSKITSNGSSVSASGSPNISLHHFRGGYDSGRTISAKNDATNRWIIGENNFASNTTIEDTNLRIEGLATALSPDGLLLMARYNNGGSRGKSSDGGSSWGLLPTLPFSSEYVWCYAGGDSPAASRWIAAFTVIRFSPDFGNTWLNREGNYSTIVAVPDIDMVFVPGITQRNAFTLYG